MTTRGGKLAACIAAGAGLLWASAACCHTVLLGALEIIHPAVAAAPAHLGGACVRVTIRNHGTQVERLMALRIEGYPAGQLLMGGTPQPGLPIAIRPGETLDLRRGACLRVEGLQRSLVPDMAVLSGDMMFQSTGWKAIDVMVDPPE